jgi:hypothetical protein
MRLHISLSPVPGIRSNASPASSNLFVPSAGYQVPCFSTSLCPQCLVPGLMLLQLLHILLSLLPGSRSHASPHLSVPSAWYASPHLSVHSAWYQVSCFSTSLCPQCLVSGLKFLHIPLSPMPGIRSHASPQLPVPSARYQVSCFSTSPCPSAWYQVSCLSTSLCPQCPVSGPMLLHISLFPVLVTRSHASPASPHPSVPIAW